MRRTFKRCPRRSQERWNRKYWWGGFAIFLGGPAALFWMWMTAFFGMTTKLVEVTLSHRYREKDDQGFIVGAHVRHGEDLNMKWLGILCACDCDQ